MVMMPLPMKALMTVAMMVGMMVPSVAPAICRYHRHLRATRTLHSAQRTILFAAGYASVWTAVGLALVACSAELSPTGMGRLTELPFARWSPVILLAAGAVQCSRWKANQLLRCRQACMTVPLVPARITTPCRDGVTLGIHCTLSCAAPMAVLLVGGLMNARMMLAITAAITAERVAPAGMRIALMTGALALVAGSVMCLPV